MDCPIVNADALDCPIPPAECVVFDPPWDSDAASVYAARLAPNMPRSLLAFSDGQRAADVIGWFGAPSWVFVWDTGSSHNVGPSRPLKGQKLCLWYGQIGDYRRDGCMWGAPPARRRHPTTRFDPDPRGRRLSDLYRKSLRWLQTAAPSGPRTAWHRHEKPIEWVRCLIANTSAGGLVFDPFCGGGGSLIAARDLGRPALGFEIDADQCLLIRERWRAGTAPPIEGLPLFASGALTHDLDCDLDEDCTCPAGA